MTTSEAVKASKTFRQELDKILQLMKDHKVELAAIHPGDVNRAAFTDFGEVIANHMLSIRHVEDAILRQGKVLQNIGVTPNPYPESKNPDSPVVAPPADGLKL